MNRYPREARNAAFKCVFCNAPITRTAGEQYVCVSCGRSPIRQRASLTERSENPGEAKHLAEQEVEYASSADTPVESHRESDSSDGPVDQRRADGDSLGDPSTVSSPDDVDAGTVGRENGEATGDSFVRPGSSRTPDVSVILPTLNEEEGVGTCIDRAKRAFEAAGVTGEIIISDSSDDRTPEIAREKGAKIVVPDKRGYGYAYRYAFDHARGDYIAIGDADTTYDFEELPKLLDPVRDGDADMIIGSRLAGRIESGAMPWLHQYVGNPLLTRFLNAFYDAGVTDAHSGFRVIRRDTLEELDLRTEGMEFASEMIMTAAVNDMTIEEVPIVYHERKGEATLDSFRDGWRHVKFMLINAPDQLFIVPGGLFILVGSLLAAVSTTGVRYEGIMFSTHTMIVASLLLILGTQLGYLSVFTDIAGDPIKPHRSRLTNWLSANYRLEYGATLGVVLLAVGGVTAGLLTVEWLAGRIPTPFIVPSLLAYTLIVLGVQIVFNSLTISVLRDGQGA